MRILRVISLAGLVAVLLLMAVSGHFLVVNAPRKSDVIVVLAGETELRPEFGLRLLDQGYAPLMLLDVPAEGKIYGWSQSELAKKYVEGLAQANSVRICPISSTSTKAETHDVMRCLEQLGARSVLLETSEFHTRRALSIFRREDRTREYSVAACPDPESFGVQWWRKREWAKTDFYESSRLLWWELVDRWF